jgi:hypothetical protein
VTRRILAILAALLCLAVVAGACTAANAGGTPQPHPTVHPTPR